MTDDPITLDEAEAIWRRQDLWDKTDYVDATVALALRRLERERDAARTDTATLSAVADAARCACKVWAILETPRDLDEVMTALVEALAMWDATKEKR